MATIAEDVKKLLGGTQDEKLEVIERRTESRLASILGVSEVPGALEYILYEVVTKRFNRIGNEGMKSYSQEGLSMAFPESDFAEYQGEINDWLNAKYTTGVVNHAQYAAASTASVYFDANLQFGAYMRSNSAAPSFTGFLTGPAKIRRAVDR